MCAERQRSTSRAVAGGPYRAATTTTTAGREFRRGRGQSPSFYPQRARHLESALRIAALHVKTLTDAGVEPQYPPEVVQLEILLRSLSSVWRAEVAAMGLDTGTLPSRGDDEVRIARRQKTRGEWFKKHDKERAYGRNPVGQG